MRLHRFFVEKPIEFDKDNSLPDERLAHQMRRVFRLHAGDKAIFFDGSGVEHVSDIVSITDETLVFHPTEKRDVPIHSSRRVTLAVSLIKKDNFEWVIQKGTELGVLEFIPIVSQRSEKKSLDMDRARKIMIEAVEQSGRAELPALREPVTLQEFLDRETREIMSFHTDGDSFSLADVAAVREVVACVGPEGGWSDEEVEAFKQKGATLVKLDAPVLRAETAATAVAALLLLL